MNNQTTFELDKKKTLIMNIPWITFILMWMIITIMSLNVVGSITDQTIKLIALIGSLFMIFRFIAWIGHPTFYEKEVYVNEPYNPNKSEVEKPSIQAPTPSPVQEEEIKNE